jgi:hypothetical protein
MNAVVSVDVIKANIVEIRAEIAELERLLDRVIECPEHLLTEERKDSIYKALDLRNYKWGMLVGWMSLIEKI